MAINPKQISVTKIYPGNYTNVLRYWHDEKTVTYLNENGVSQNLVDQPVGGPVGVIFRPGWVAQQAVGYVDLSYKASSSANQLESYATPFSSGLNNANAPFYNGDIIIPSPDYHKDIRADIADGIQPPSGAFVYRVGLRVDGGDVVNSGIAGGVASPTLGVGPAVGVGLNTNVSTSGFFATVVGANNRITNGSYNSTNAWDPTKMHAITNSTTQYKLYSVFDNGGASGFRQGSGVYDPRAATGRLSGRNKALAICEVCWLVPDAPPERDDVALQPAGLVESNTYTSTVPQ